MLYLKYLWNWVKTHGWTTKVPADAYIALGTLRLLGPMQWYKEHRRFEFWRKAARDRIAVKEGHGSHKLQQFRDKYNTYQTKRNQ